MLLSLLTLTNFCQSAPLRIFIRASIVIGGHGSCPITLVVCSRYGRHGNGNLTRVIECLPLGAHRKHSSPSLAPIKGPILTVPKRYSSTCRHR
jgi:hypothetical protein